MVHAVIVFMAGKVGLSVAEGVSVQHRDRVEQCAIEDHDLKVKINTIKLSGPNPCTPVKVGYFLL